MNQIENTLTSLEVAEMVGKDHNTVMRDIRQIIEDLGKYKSVPSSENIDIKTFFTESTYISAQNKELPCYLVSKQGCEVFGNRMKGAKGTQFTVSYVSRFNQMENNIKQTKIPTTQRELVQLALAANEETNQRLDVVENTVLDLTDRFGLPSNKAKVLQKRIAAKVYIVLGGRDSNAYKKISRKVFREFYKGLNNWFDVAKYSDIPLSRYDEALEYVHGWQPSTNTNLEIRVLNSQTSFEF